MQAVIKNIRGYFLAAIATATIVVWYAAFYFEAHQNLVVTFFDVGQGDAIFIESPNGNQILIDGGPSDRILGKLGRVMPFWDRSIDLLVLTHPHADHLDGALAVLKRYQIAAVIESGVNHSIPEYDEWRAFLKEKNVKTIIAEAGDRVRFSGIGALDIISPLAIFEGASPKNIHDSMVVSRLVYGSTTALLMGDAERSLEYLLLAARRHFLDADILKVGHHGSKTSTSDAFLSAVSPRFAVIQSGRPNRYGHPHQEVLDRLAAFGVKIFRNDVSGDVIFKSDGSRFYLVD